MAINEKQPQITLRLAISMADVLISTIIRDRLDSSLKILYAHPNQAKVVPVIEDLEWQRTCFLLVCKFFEDVLKGAGHNYEELCGEAIQILSSQRKSGGLRAVPKVPREGEDKVQEPTTAHETADDAHKGEVK